MSGNLSKRQQARNERTLQDLIKSVPGNNVCADCQARNPGWASWSLGIFLCMRCAALHRKMGTHITKVKSLSMDSWSNDQVENMKRVGNIASNRIYNPTNARPPIPLDVDEADSAMERFIRQKYVERAAARNDTGSTTSDDNPPPLPPKTGSKFGFRSGASIFPLSSKTRREPPPPVEIIHRRRTPSPGVRSPPRSVDTGPLDLAGKMAKLKDMGFTDAKRNLAVLNGLGGNLEKTINTLVRLGEGNGNIAGDSASSRGSRTPVTPAFPSSPGLAVNRGRDKPTPSPKNSQSPFDLLDIPPPAQPQSSQSTGSKGNLQPPAANNPFLSPTMNTNPFGIITPSQSQYALNQAFQNMAVSENQPAQPLFPNHTGGFPTAQPPQHQLLYQQSMTPPVPSVPQQYYPTPSVYNTNTQPVSNASYNPFFQEPVRQAQPVQQAPNVNTNFQNNPYTQQGIYSSPVEQNNPAQFPSSIFDQGGQQQQQQIPTHSAAVYNQPVQQQIPQASYNPFLTQATSPQQAQPQQMPQQTYGYQNQQAAYQHHLGAQTYPQPGIHPVKANNQSILDLFNYPQLAPTKPAQENTLTTEQAATVHSPNYTVTSPTAQPQISQTLTAQASFSGSKNPFNTGLPVSTPPQPQGRDLLGTMSAFPGAQPQNNGTRHISHESMSIDVGGWQNGRHSPDAWGTISARSR